MTYHKDGSVSFEAGPRHEEMIIRQLGLEGSKGISTPGEKKKSSDAVATSGLPPMNPEGALRCLDQVRARFLGLGEVTHKKDEKS